MEHNALMKSATPDENTTAALGAIDNPIASLGLPAFPPGHLSALSLRREAQVVQGGLEHRQEAMNPVIGLRLTEAEQLALHDLERVGLLIDQNEQQLRFGRWQNRGTSTAGLPLASLAGERAIHRIASFIGSDERREHTLELPQGQARQCQESPWLSLDLFIGEHA